MREITTDIQQRVINKFQIVLTIQRKAAQLFILEYFHTARSNQMKTLMNCFNLNETAQKQQLLKDKNTFPIISVTLLSSTPAIPLNLHYSYGNCKLIWHTLTCFFSKTIRRAFNWKLTFISFQIKCHRSVCFWGGGQMGESICHKNYVFKNKLVATGFNVNLFTKRHNAATSCATVATCFSCKNSH